MSVEYVPWYNPGASVVRCMECSSMLTAGDTDVHTEWHESQKNVENLLLETMVALNRLTKTLVEEKKRGLGL